MLKCSECGYENIDGLDYCDGCGAKLAAGAGAAPNGGAAAPAASEAPAAAPEAPAAEAGGGAAPGASEAPTGEITPPAASAPAAAAPEAAVVAAFKAKLQIVRGEGKGQDLPLDDGNNVIGRWDPETGAFPEVDLDKYDPEAKVSRKHALVRIDGGKVTVEDMGSLNGTFVNRQPRLAPGTPIEIKAGDEIIIGKTFLKLVIDPIS
jgi:hypothetical protein